MADQVQLPEVKPGMVVWMGRFRNRAGIISRVFDENGKLKYEVIPIPQGRKKSKVRNILPFKIMEPEDAAKYRKMYDDEQREKRQKSARVMDRYLSANASDVGSPSSRGHKVWESEDGSHRVYSSEGEFQSQFRLGRQWYTDGSFDNFKEAVRAVRVAMIARAHEI